MTLTLALTGDSIITRGMPPAGKRQSALRDLIRAADVAFTNLEVVPADYQGYPSSAPLTPTVLAPASVLDTLSDLGFDVVSLANNHAMNLGIEGMLAAVRELDARGLGHCGAGRDLADAAQPAFIDRSAGSVAVLAVTSTFAPGEEASRPAELLRGRPGLNPLRHTTRLHVTAAQLAALAEAHEQLGLGRERAYLRQVGLLPAAAPGDRELFGAVFAESGQAAVRTRCVPADLDRICRWVQEAKARSDVTVVSVHSHESGASLNEPAEFITELGRAVIDAGADAVAGHGDHRLRAVELYRGRPIFYGLGNFISQFELQTVISAHVYDVFGAPAEATAHEVIGGGALSFAAGPEYARSVVAVLTYGAAGLQEIRLHPVTLGFGLPPHRRGRPALAAGPARDTLAGMAGLSAARGTAFRWDEGTALVLAGDGDSGPQPGGAS
jgi:poly-gamma-glutamate capsule biosynthesis protein CapA/YwtB (metallophosphatase superfamily)